ncbi:PAAR domain-containing protein [Burkholderia pyrrocinia]|uniref:PAAR domain-containing protein n=1 Tax=Burkholderia cenocepacia TaxID=95486 RepID=UPI00158D13D6|nr:PAAR domain-containing protein [Burkholderia cenocepacia]EKS9889659.1 PAAR domain-containing protein [Burkholderia pyrrocinia]EKS9898395.1 PAAR domain-containing protein [Burkholderia pyrrocinia]EKS9911093.1 PAAR domain-containing protein [Burkholderia pyrrocinia]
MSHYAAVRKGDFVTCPHCRHTRISFGSTDVIIEGEPAARLTEKCNCGGTLTNPDNSHGVFINGRPAAVCATHAASDHHHPVTGARSVFIGTQTTRRREKRGVDDPSIPMLRPRADPLLPSYEDATIPRNLPPPAYHNRTTEITLESPPSIPLAGSTDEISMVLEARIYEQRHRDYLTAMQQYERDYARYQRELRIAIAFGETNDVPTSPTRPTLPPPPPSNDLSQFMAGVRHPDESVVRGQTCVATDDGTKDCAFDVPPQRSSERIYRSGGVGATVCVARQTPRDAVQRDGFQDSGSQAFLEVPCLLPSDHVLAASTTPHAAMAYGRRYFTGPFHIYRIDAQRLRGAALVDNIDSPGARRIFNFGNGSRTIPGNNARLLVVHIDNAQLRQNLRLIHWIDTVLNDSTPCAARVAK